MSAAQWRSYVIGSWIVLSLFAFLAVGSTTERSWLLLLAAGVIPPAMLLWLWNEDRPLTSAPLRVRNRR